MAFSKTLPLLNLPQLLLTAVFSQIRKRCTRPPWGFQCSSTLALPKPNNDQWSYFKHVIFTNNIVIQTYKILMLIIPAWSLLHTQLPKYLFTLHAQDATSHWFHIFIILQMIITRCYVPEPVWVFWAKSLGGRGDKTSLSQQGRRSKSWGRQRICWWKSRFS